MNTEETIAYLKREIEIYGRLVKQRERYIRDTNPNIFDAWLEEYKQTLRELKEELEEILSEDIL